MPDPYLLRGLPLAECSECCEPIRFVRLDTGKAMPVNPATNTTGSIAAVKVGKALHGFVVTANRLPAPRTLRFTPHYATCSAVERPTPRPPDPTLFDA